MFVRDIDQARGQGTLRAVLALGLALAAAPAFAQGQAADTDSDDEKVEAASPDAKAKGGGENDGPSAADLAAGMVVTKDKGGVAWHLNASLSHFVGQGVFASGVGRNGTVLSQLAVSPTLSWHGVLFFASQAMQWEYTKPDNPSGRRVALFDTTLGAQYVMPIEAIDTRIALSGGVRLPVSWQSRAQGSIGGVFGGATAFWSTPLDGLQVVLGLRAQGNSSIESLRATGAEDGPSLAQEAANCFTRLGESASDACGPVPNVANLSGRLQLTYTIGKLTTSVGLSFLSFVSAYSGPDDGFTADAARAGVNANTFTTGTIQVTYPVASYLILTGGLSSFQPIQTAGGNGMRFPFWNFSGVANAYSSLFVGSSFFF